MLHGLSSTLADGEMAGAVESFKAPRKAAAAVVFKLSAASEPRQWRRGSPEAGKLAIPRAAVADNTGRAALLQTASFLPSGLPPRLPTCGPPALHWLYVGQPRQRCWRSA